MKRSAVRAGPLPAAPLGLALLAGACAADGGLSGDTAFVRDSAGVTVVESRAPSWGAGGGWRVESEPSLRIGEAEGDPRYLLARVVGATRLPDGTVVVGDGMSNQLRFFDRRGGFLHAVGREGQGPGEFEYLRALQRCSGDSIVAFDLHWQPKVYDHAGGLNRESRITEPGAARSPYGLACRAAGGYVVTGWGEVTGPRLGFYEAHAPAWILDSDGEPTAKLGLFLSSERIGNEGGSRPHPFGRGTLVATAGERILVGTSTSFGVRVYDGDGTLRALYRAPDPELSIRPEYLDRYRDELLAGTASEGHPAVERFVRELPLPPAFPAYDRMLADSDGNLWLRRFRRPGEEEVPWAVLDPDGVWLGDVTVPPELEVTEIGSDYLLGIHTDDLGVQRVQLHGLVR